MPAETAKCFGPLLFFLPLALEHQQTRNALEMGKQLCFRGFSEELVTGQGQLLRVTVVMTRSKSLQTYFPFQEARKVSALSHFETEK